MIAPLGAYEQQDWTYIRHDSEWSWLVANLLGLESVDRSGKVVKW
jgi:hypothetical protein